MTHRSISTCRMFSFLLLLIICIFSSKEMSAHVDPSQQSVPQIIKSPGDPREFRYLTLENGIKVVLVSSPAVGTAAMAAGVNVGSNQNPHEWPGLAHLLEHMLFLGSNKYPEPDAFDAFIGAHGGDNNAWTGDTDTTYYFTIHQEQLYPAMDRLAQFFISPLLAPELIDREIHAVDSEFQIYRQQDSWRAIMVSRTLLNPDHPASRFGVGNLKTLRNHDGLELREALRAFHRMWYVSGNLSIVVVSSSPIDEMATQVKNIFGKIPSQPSPKRPELPPIYTDKEKGLRIDMQTQQQGYSLLLTFPLPVDDNYLQEKSTQYIVHLLGHEAEGSLHSLLVERGWVSSINAQEVDDTREARIKLAFSLTKEGFEQIEEITGLTFEYIQLIEKEGVNQVYFKELQTQWELEFRYMPVENSEDTANFLIDSMTVLPPEYLIKGHFVVESFNPKKVRSILKSLTPENMIMQVMNDRPPSVSAEEVITEPWMGMAYSVRKFTDEERNLWRSPILGGKKLALPPKNIFMLGDMSLNEEPETPLPELLSEGESSLQAWVRHDNSFEVPKTNVFVRFHQQRVISTAEANIQFSLYTQLLSDSFNETLYMAELAGLTYGIDNDHNGFFIVVSGYNEQLPAFLDALLRRMKTLRIVPEKLRQKKEYLTRLLDNVAYSPPLTLLKHAFMEMKFDYEFSTPQLRAALDTITTDSLQQWSHQLFEQTRVTVLINGNASRKQVKRMIEGIKPYVSVEFQNQKEVLQKLAPKTLEKNTCHISYTNEDFSIFMVNTAVDQKIKTRATYQLLTSLMSTPFYNQLRTQEQLGYMVSVFYNENNRFPTMNFIIQSPEYSPETLDQRISTFFKNFRKTLSEITEQQLDDLKISTIAGILSDPQTLAEQSMNFWIDLNDDFIDFDQSEQLVGAIDKVTLQELQALFQSLMENHHTLKLYGYNQDKLPEILPPSCRDPAFMGQFIPQE